MHELIRDTLMWSEIAVLLVFPLVLGAMTGSMKISVCAAWGAYVLYYIVVSLWAPSLFGQDQMDMVFLFPEGNIVVAALVFGWAPALVLGSIGVAVRHLICWLRNKPIKG